MSVRTWRFKSSPAHKKTGEAGFFDEGEGVEFIQPREDLNAGVLFFQREK